MLDYGIGGRFAIGIITRQYVVSAGKLVSVVLKVLPLTEAMFLRLLMAVGS